MKLLKTLVEAVASKSKMAAQTILSSEEQIATMARGAAAVLKKNFGERLMDTPMAMITQQVRSYVDATTGTRLGKDGLEQVTQAVVSQLRPYLGESKVDEDDEEVTEAFSDEDANGEENIEEGADMVKGAVAALKKTFGAKLMDTPMAVITQHVRSHLDSATGTKLSKDKLEKLTRSVVAGLRSHLGEGKLEEGKMAELDDDLTSLTSEEFKKKYGCSKKDMRAKTRGDGKEKTVKEAVDTVHGVMDQILDDTLDAYDVMIHPQTPGQRAAAKIIQRMYDQQTYGDDETGGLHADDDVDQIMLNVYEEIEAEYGPDAGKSSFESVQESEEEVEEAKEEAPAKKRGRPSKKVAEEKPATKKQTKADDSDDEEDTKKVSSKALAKSMEKDDDGEDDDADVKKADSASKDKPKKIVDTSVKPDQLKTAYENLSKRIQHAVDTSSASSAFELSKELRATFKDITTDEVKQATAIWKSEN